MHTYDPLKAQDPDAWLAIDEGERLLLVLDHHRAAGVELPNEQVHAAMHVAVENQIALGDEIPVEATLERLMREALDRHEAVHAIATVLIGHMQALVLRGDTEGDEDVNEPYYEELEKLTAAGWREEYG